MTAAGNKSFAPGVFKLWINTIVLQNDEGGSNQFYTCDSSAADCEVDFASSESVAAFESKLNAIEITAGNYNKLWIFCNPGSAGYVKYKGHATVNGTTQYTADPDSNSGSPVTTDSAKNGEITVANVGCGLTMHLPQTLTVGQCVVEGHQDARRQAILGGDGLWVQCVSAHITQWRCGRGRDFGRCGDGIRGDLQVQGICLYALSLDALR